MSFDRSRLLPLSSWTVRAIFFALFVIAAGAFAVFAPPTSFALEETTTDEQLAFDVHSRRMPDGRFTVVVTVKAPGGAFTNATEFESVPDTRVMTHNAGGREYKTTVHINGDGSGSATLDVLDGPRTLSSHTRNFQGIALGPPTPAGYKRVGGDVKAPKIISTVDPIYPADAKANRISGVVVLELLISDTGNVTEARVLKPLPYGLDQSAVDAVKQWKFLPGTLNGAPVAVSFNLTINFRLDE